MIKAGDPRWFGLLGLFVLVAVLLSGCAVIGGAPGSSAPLVRLAVADYPDFSDGFCMDNLGYAIDQSLAYLNRVPEQRTFRFGEDVYNALHLKRSLGALQAFTRTRPDPADMNRFIRQRFRVYRSVGGPEHGTVLFTGYFEPYLRGSRTPDDRYRYPVYPLPDDLMIVDLSPFGDGFKGKRIVARLDGKNLVPYPDRKTLENDPEFFRKAAPIAWVDDRIDLFFLQIQGSGRIYLTDGSFIRVHYHAANGQPYRSIGRLLIDQGKIPAEEMSMQRLRHYLEAHPDEVDAIFNYNPSYVFFKTEDAGPFGAINIPLTPGRSVAVDRRVFPMAAPAFFETRIPMVDGHGKIARWTEHSAFAVNQDTGGAIRGPGRVDIFWGNGPYARIAAGHMKEHGAFYLLVLDPEKD